MQLFLLCIKVRTSHERTKEPISDGFDARAVPTDSSLLMGTTAAAGGGLPRDETAAAALGGLPQDEPAAAAGGGLPRNETAAAAGGGLSRDGTATAAGGGLPRDETGARFYWQLALRSDAQALPIAIIRYDKNMLHIVYAKNREIIHLFAI